MIRCHAFNLDGYPIGIMIAVGASKEEMISAAAERGCSTDTCLKMWRWKPSETTDGHCAVLPCHRVIVWFKTREILPQTVAHEAFHAIYGVLPQLGIRLSSATEEVFAYAIENLTRQIHGVLAEITAEG